MPETELRGSPMNTSGLNHRCRYGAAPLWRKALSCLLAALLATQMFAFSAPATAFAAESNDSSGAQSAQVEQQGTGTDSAIEGNQDAGDTQGNAAAGEVDSAAEADAYSNAAVGDEPAVASTLGSDAVSLAASGQTGAISVYIKLFGLSKDAGDKFPTFTYTLYRTTDASASDPAWDLVTTKTFRVSGWGVPGLYVDQFDLPDLAAYAPDGTAYRYKLVQDTVDGYKTAADKVRDGAQPEESNFVDYLSVVNMSDYSNDHQAVFENTYTPSSVAVSGSVSWNDSDNAWGTRQDIFGILELTRSYEDGSGSSTVELQNTDPSAANYFSWTGSTTGSDAYTSFSVSNLSKWAHGGESWVYSLRQNPSKVQEGSSLDQYFIGRGPVTAKSSAENPSFSSSLYNKLEGTGSLSVAVNWKDSDNVWGMRSTVWVLLQRKVADGDWEWVTTDGHGVSSAFTRDGERLNDYLLMLNLSEKDAKDGDASTWQKAFTGLPEVDSNTYRAVEILPARYSLTTEGATLVASNGWYNLYSAGNGSVALENTLDTETVELNGGVQWFNRGYSLPDPSNVKLVLQQYKGQDDTNPVTIPLEKTSFEWDHSTGNYWNYAIEGLPTTAMDGTAYYYKMTEVDASSVGYYSANPTAFARYYKDGLLLNDTIVNTVTQLSLDKVGAAGEQAVSLNDVEFTIKNASGDTVAVWSRNGQGKVKVTSSYGYSSATDGRSGITHLLGLPAGTYTVSDTGASASYVAAPDFEVTIGTDGAVSSTSSSVSVKDSDGDGIADFVTTSGDVLRGTFVFALTADDDTPVEGMAFELYKSDGTLVAKGLTTDAEGKIASESSDVAYEAGANLGVNYTKLSDGLPVGEYYLLEVGEKGNLVKPTGEDAKKSFSVRVNSDKTQQPLTAYAYMKNKLFDPSSVYLTLADLTDGGQAITGAKFELKYKAPEADGYTTIQKLSTDDDGEVWFKDLMKGSYTLTEVSNTGYVVPEGGIKVADFIIDEDDANQDRDLGSDYSRNAIEATNVDQSLIYYDVMVNDRLTGAVTMKKVDESGKGVAGSVFKLQAKGNDGTWTDVDGKTSLTTGSDGVITVDGLAWGTYRFAEVSPASGSDGITEEATIDRDKVASVQDCGTVTAYAVSVTLKRTYEDVNLKGTQFSVTPGQGSRFADGTEEEKVFTTGDDGTVTLAGVLAQDNTYVIKEAAAASAVMLLSAEPASDDPAADELTIKVRSDGSIEVVGSAPDAFDVDKDSATITKKDEPTDAPFFVISCNKEGMAIPGAEYELSGTFASGTSSMTLAVNKYGYVSLDGGQLVTGETYILKETKAPAGHKLCSGELQFKANGDGSIEAVGEVPAAYAVYSDAAAVIVNEEATVLTVNVPAGAEFSVTPAEGSAFADGTKAAKTLITGDKDTASLSAQLVAGNTYILKETKAPAGYKLCSDELQFAVNSDGAITAVGEVPATFVVEGATVAVTNAPATFAITKVGAYGVPLSGATFSLSGNFADGTTSKTLTTNENGEAVLPDALLRADGSSIYILKETQAPDDYLPNLNGVKFTVGTDGVIDIQGAPAGYEVDDDTGTSIISTGVHKTFGSFQLSLKATVNSKAPKAGQTFEFSATATGENADSAPKFENVTTDADGFATFRVADLSDENAGQTYTYCIHQTTQLGDGWTSAGDVTATVVVGTRDEGGKLPVTITYNDAEAEAAAFNNVYEASGELAVDVSVTVNGGASASGKEFELGLYETDESGAKKGEPISTVKVKAGQTATLSGVWYDQDDAGQTCTYVVGVLGDLGEGWTKAADQKVDVAVLDNGDGTITADVDYGTDDQGKMKTALVFDNTYAQPASSDSQADGKSASQNGGSSKASSAKTGDNMLIFGGAAMVLAIGAAGAVLLAYRRKRS